MNRKKTTFEESMERILQRHGIYDSYDISRDISHKKTGNIWIDCYIKNSKGEWVESGINVNEALFLYVVGDFDQYYILAKKHLKTIQRKHELRTTKDGKHKGFLLSIREAEHINIVSFTYAMEYDAI